MAQIDIRRVSAMYLRQIGFDAARCAALSMVALGIGWPMGARLPRTRWWTAILLAPLLTPALLVSYAYQPWALRLTGTPALLLLAYSALLTLKLAALAGLARSLLPSGVPRESLYCAQLIERRSLSSRLAFSLHAMGPTPWIVLILSFLLAFTDFELASLLSVKSWPVLLFDAHAGGLELRNSLQRVLVPLGIEAALLALAMVALGSAPREAASPVSERSNSKWPLFAAALISALAAFIPLGTVLVQAIRGLPTLTYTGVAPLSEIMTSLGFAIAGAGLAWILAGIGRSVRFGSLLILPGLLGSLVLALLLLALFQTPFLRFAYDTPAPLTLALALLFAPVALLLRWILQVHRPREALHLARMAGVRRLLWEVAVSRQVAAIGLVFLFAYFELTASALLAPMGFTPAFVRLHNLAHYGQTPILSLMLAASTLTPAALLALTLGLGRLYARRDAR